MGATAQVLRGLPRQDNPNLLVGTDHFDDAGVYQLDDATALVVTVDFFPPLVDDPFQFGRIAAANSLSDVYAMGGRPLTALNIVGFPDNEMPVEILGEILRGGADRVAAAGAVTAGGHSVRDAEIKYGLSVTGIVHPDHVWTNGGAREGDVLVLSKPIGSGILTSAGKLGKISVGEMEQAIDVMTDLNAGACLAARKVGVHGVTDITGFGLLGHACEMADGSDVSIEIEAGAVPLLEQAVALANRKLLTRAYVSNLEALGDKLETGGVDRTLIHILADAQTSGGLLMAVDRGKTDALVSALKANSTRASEVIGRCVARTRHSITLV